MRPRATPNGSRGFQVLPSQGQEDSDRSLLVRAHVCTPQTRTAPRHRHRPSTATITLRRLSHPGQAGVVLFVVDLPQWLPLPGAGSPARVTPILASQYIINDSKARAKGHQHQTGKGSPGQEIGYRATSHAKNCRELSYRRPLKIGPPRLGTCSVWGFRRDSRNDLT